MSSFGDPFNSYESPPTFDNESPHSADSTDTVNLFPERIPKIPSPNLFTQQQSLSPIPPLIPASSLHTMSIYPSKDTNTSNPSTAKTIKHELNTQCIFKDFPTSINERQSIFDHILCDAFVFDIGWYIKKDLSQDQNILMITIEHKKSKRGTKRKALQSDGNTTKKRRLNNSQSQSYSINNHHRSPNKNDDDDNIVSDNIELLFSVHIASPEDNHPFTKTYKCTFGDKDDESISYNNWNSDTDTDSECANYTNLSSFKTETFEELSARYCVSKETAENSQFFYVWCELQIQNAEENKDHYMNIVYPRPKFEKRKITKFVGLRNEGATCYMNSLLQTLYHIAALRRNVYKIPVGHEAEQRKKAQQIKKDEVQSIDKKTDDGLSEDDDDDIDTKPKKNAKPPISLELQRLFYQLQTGAESNHQNEYELHVVSAIDDDGNDSDCSIFTLKSDPEFASGMSETNGEKPTSSTNSKKAMDDDDCDDDDDVDMTLPDNDIASCNGWQSSYDKAVSTSQLIKSFGWSGSDAFVQHDVQEFLRVLMDKIEAKVKGTPSESIVEKLFSGEYESYVKCCNVSYESVRNENFQDIQLTIPKSVNNGRRSTRRRYWGRQHDNATDVSDAPDIYDCIRKFIEPETLDGNNQYYANDDLGKQDADKGLRFKRFPPVLFLQLCRFEIDHYQHTSKINNPVKFYEDIDLNPFVYVESSTRVSGQNTFYNHLPCDCDGRSEFSYQLFSVLVHSGSTYGGHYFAYINPSGSQWYKFDDENVCCVDVEEATVKQYGGNSRQSAYMLVYIQKKYAQQILREINENDIPKDLRRYFSVERQKAQQKRLEQIENGKKCLLQYMNGHDLCTSTDDNILDMGMRQLLQTKNVYKDTMFGDILSDWCTETAIPMDHLLIWNYTERKNKTLRANRQIVLDLAEESKTDKEYSEDCIKRHLIKTIPQQKKVKSIYDRIGNILEKKRMFVLLDSRRISTLNGSEKGRILVALKYFDFIKQKLYFMDWIFVTVNVTTFGDIAQHICDKLITKLSDYQNYKMNKFLFYEEEAVLKNVGTRDNPLCKVTPWKYSDVINGDFYYGDLFVFQFNPLEQCSCEVDGVYWYPFCDAFILSQLNMVNVEVRVRENAGWKQQWSKALLLQYKNSLNTSIDFIDKELRKKITKSKHKLFIEKKTTFGMIRKKLGKYYNINPHHIEIWLPQHSYSGDKWDYGSKGRGKWNASLDNILSSRPEWQQCCPLKFEIQTYNVKDFDEMTSYDDYTRCGGQHTQFAQRIMKLAMFNFEFVAPNRMKENNQMTVSFCKDWCAKEMIEYVLREVIQNPIFGYTFFINVIKYIKKYENNTLDNDLLILQNLAPNRFLIIDENETKLPSQYHMNDKYVMPDVYSQIKYTDFKVFFLAQNDPLVMHKSMTKALWVFLQKSGVNNKSIGLIRIVLQKGESLKDVILLHCLPYLKTPKPSLSVDDNKDETTLNEDDILFQHIMETHKFVIKEDDNPNAQTLNKVHLENETIFDSLNDNMHLHIFIPKNKSKYTSYHDRPLTIGD